MKCHYEVLNVAKDAEDSDIKTAYKKLALKWHPDKNLDNPDEAKEQFQLVQQAYEVLIDRQERAWYDNHREQILRGANSEFQDNSLNVYPYFTTTCFKGYGDDEESFYSVYRKVFDQIIEEDLEFFEDKDDYDMIPRFGKSTSDYDEVVGPFYAYWMSYSTKKSYVWLDPYSINDTRDRRILKLIEKDNKKVRQKAKKERNEEVRELVAFVRKRDKRVQENAKRMEAKIAENRKKQEEISKQKRLQRIQELNTSGNQAEWMKFDNVKSGLEEIEKNLAEQFGEEFSGSEEEEEIDLNDLYCVACNKMFKTQKALQSHEQSKKHKENVETLKQIMLDEEGVIEEEEVEESDNEEIEIITNSSDSEVEVKISKKQKKKNKKSKNVLRVKTISETDGTSEGEHLHLENVNNGIASDEDFSKKSKKKNRKSNAKPKKNNSNIVESEIPKDEEKVEPENGVDNEDYKEIEKETIPESSQKSKNKFKKNKKSNKEDLKEIDIDHLCVTCKANFSSKNKLFQHLQSTGHSVYLGKNESKPTKAKKKLREK